MRAKNSGVIRVLRERKGDKMKQVRDHKTNQLIGFATETLAERSAERPTGVIPAYLKVEDESIWEYCPDCECDRYRRLGYEVRTVYVG
jgi:hypothetical protein